MRLPPSGLRIPLPFITTLALGLLVAGGAAGQLTPTVRLRGRVLAGDGTGLQGVAIRTDAVRGVAGGQFTGQREFKAKTDKKGDWSVLGITRGLWIFEFSADGHFPHVVAVPVMMMESSPLATVPWYLVVTLQRESEGGVVTEPLRKVVERLASGSRDEALAMFHQIPVAAAPAEGLCAAGDVALLLRDSGTARGLFAQVAQARPDWPRAQIGFASAAILQGDYGAAGTAFAKVRDATTNQEVKQAMSAVIKDLMLISREQ